MDIEHTSANNWAKELETIRSESWFSEKNNQSHVRSTSITKNVVYLFTFRIQSRRRCTIQKEKQMRKYNTKLNIMEEEIRREKNRYRAIRERERRYWREGLLRYRRGGDIIKYLRRVIESWGWRREPARSLRVASARQRDYAHHKTWWIKLRQPYT